MKALIFNSGMGSRMGSLTADAPKGLLKLHNGESIFARQLRILGECGISQAVVTTGEWETELLAESRKQTNVAVEFVNNPLYASTNYIYSLHLAAPYLDDDVLMLHGDLVFDQGIVQVLLTDSRADLCVIDPYTAGPQKDFKGRIIDGLLREVSVHISDADCYALQPMYKLSANAMKQWLAQVGALVRSGITNVYAEEALNAIAGKLHMEVVSYAPYFIREIDTPEDYASVSAALCRCESGAAFHISALQSLCHAYGTTRPFAIMGRHLRDSEADHFLDTLPVAVEKYYGVKENPDTESVAAALEAFVRYDGDLLISIGGGSAIDTAKGVKYALLEQPRYQGLAHIAIPTTAGSGSEATRFAVIYQNGEKTSLEHDALLPEHCILDSTLLYSMTAQQRKVSLLDVFCHSIESFLSCHATSESRTHAASALSVLTVHWESFVNGDRSVYDAVLGAANDAGRAINRTKTTFAHAMSYVLTSEYGIRHGQAAAICLIHGLRYAEQNLLQFDALSDIRRALGCGEDASAAEKIASIYHRMQPEEHFCLKDCDPAALVKRVNAQRLSNSVIPFAENDLLAVYTALVRQYS